MSRIQGYSLASLLLEFLPDMVTHLSRVHYSFFFLTLIPPMLQEFSWTLGFPYSRIVAPVTCCPHLCPIELGCSSTL